MKVRAGEAQVLKEIDAVIRRFRGMAKGSEEAGLSELEICLRVLKRLGWDEGGIGEGSFLLKDLEGDQKAIDLPACRLIFDRSTGRLLRRLYRSEAEGGMQPHRKAQSREGVAWSLAERYLLSEGDLERYFIKPTPEAKRAFLAGMATMAARLERDVRIHGLDCQEVLASLMSKLKECRLA